VYDGPDREVNIDGWPVEMIFARPLDLCDLSDGSVREPREVPERYEQPLSNGGYSADVGGSALPATASSEYGQIWLSMRTRCPLRGIPGYAHDEQRTTLPGPEMPIGAERAS